MTELQSLFRRAAEGFGRHVHAVAAGQWHDPTPCDDWDVRTLVNHVAVEQLWVPPLAGGSTVADIGDRLDGDQLGDDPIAAWDAAVEASLQAFEAPGAIDGTVMLSSGERPMAEYCWEMTTDALIHSWDLARGIGADETLDAELSELVYERTLPIAAQLQETGMFKPPVPVPDDAALQTKLLAIFGRRVGDGVAKPAILTVDDDPAVSQAITRDLRRQYGSEYQIVRATSGAEGLTVLTELAVRERPVALIASDQRMPEMTGIEFFEQARPHAQDAKLVLLTAYADTDVAIRAINDLGLDYYLLKPWDPPGERLYPVLDDLLSDWRREHVDELGGVRVVGHRWSERSHELKTFLARNHVPYRWLDLERDAEAGRLATLAGGGDDALPLVFVPDGETLHAPSLVDLADALGLRTHAEQPLYDLCIVGGGPAGLAAAVYAASEGLQTVVIEREAPGGQAGQSAAIENYLGFPKGLSGADLTQRAVAQAARFGAEMVLARDVVNFEARGPVRCVSLGTDTEIEARSLLVATGVSYRMLDAPGLADLTGRGVFYGATASEARSTRDADVYIVGAANSAGQAALNLARFASRVVLLVRSDELEKSMSRYLVERIRATTNIEVRLQSEVVKGRGNEHLEAITIADRAAGTEEEFETEWLFVFIGASPRTDWLGDGVVRDDKGFIITGHDLLTHAAVARWPLSRIPYTLETSVPGVFAAGDVRLDSMKRVASAVGEGAMSVYLVHRYLATI